MEACKEAVNETATFDLAATLSRHGWKGEMDLQATEQMLKTRAPYSYLIRLGEDKTKFILSWVNAQGELKHSHFALIDWVNGIFKNLGPYTGTLDFFVLHKLDCTAAQARPL